MSYDALRAGRVSLARQAYLVTTVTRDRRPWFAEFALARQVIEEMRRLEREGCLHSLAWVLMPDHLHWLFQLGDTVSLSQAIKAFKGRSAQRVNRSTRHDGAIWQKAFYDRALRNEGDLPTVARYIVANPLRAGLVTSIGDYPHWDARWLE